MIELLIAERYARGLNAALGDDTESEAALAALRLFAAVFEESGELRAVLSNPALDVETRGQMLDDVFDSLDTSAPVRRLIQLMLRRGRISLLTTVAGAFETLVDQRFNRVAATVTSAAPLADDQRERIEAGLARFSGKHVRTTYQIDPDLIAGVVARIGGRVVDGSLRTRLEHIQEALIAEEIEAE